MKIVSLCPSLTELVFDLGRGKDLVGITRFCVHPPDRVGAVEKVGGTKDPDVARIVELAPDLVLMNEEENRREDYDALVAAGIRCLSTFPKDSLDTAMMVREIGDALSRTRVAEKLAAEIEARTLQVLAEAGGLEPVWFVYLIWRKPWMTVNADTFSHSLLAQAGGANVFAAREDRYPTIELDEVRLARPDVVLLSTEPYHFGEKHVTEVACACGLRVEQVRVVDGEYLSWYGSRTVEGVEYAARVLREGEGGRP